MTSSPGPGSSIVLYRTEDGSTRVECRFEDETLWLTQAQMAELYQTSVPNINTHLKALYGEGELSERATIKSYLIVQNETGRQVRRDVLHYALPAILAVGFRVRSQRGTQFRQWATDRLSEFLLKGFVMDDERLRDPPGPGVPDYFDELLARIQDIRASERRMYLRAKEILALAADYTPSDKETQTFFQTMQNKLLFAATGHTAAEIVARRADAQLPNMGLTSWKGGVVRKRDVTIAKNYLTETEIDELNRIVVMFLDFATDQAMRRKQIFLADWKERLDAFLAFNERPILTGAGTRTQQQAQKKAHEEYEAFEEKRRALKEADGEAESIRALEATARLLARRQSKHEDAS